MTSPIKINNHCPLTSPQREIWLDQILHEGIPLYNLGGYMRIDGPIDPARFEKALNQVIEENDALRIILHEGESLPTQTFTENVHLNLDFYDFSEQKNAHESALKWIRSEFVKPFQLFYERLLFQFALCKVADNCYYWFKKYHHLIADGWSMSLIAQHLATAYNVPLADKSQGEKKYYSYREFVKNDQAYFDSDKFTQAKRYWLSKYQELPEPLLVHHHAANTMKSQRSVTLSSPLVTFQPGDKNRLPFFCMHPIGGNVFWYRDLARHLGVEHPFYGLQSAGLYGEREPLSSIEEMASLYIEALQTIQPQGPYQLGGWSLGGVVAFEMAQQLRKQGHQIKLLALIDSYVPTANNFPKDIDESQLMKLFTRDLSSIFGNPLTLEERQQRESDSYQQLNFTLEQAKKLNDLPANLKQQHHLWQVFKANRLAITCYQPQHYLGQLIWFGASYSRITTSKAISEWQRLTTSGTEIYIFPCDHYSLLQEPTVKLLAEKLSIYLN